VGTHYQKTKAYKVSTEDPLEALPVKVLVHDYTQKGLFEHFENQRRTSPDRPCRNVQLL
jgi:hypothetical protein